MKKKTWILLLAGWLISCQSVYGLGAVSVDTSVPDVITLTAEMGEEFAGREAAIEVLYPGQGLPSGSEQVKTAFGYLGQATLDKTGSFAVTFAPGDTAGYYTVRVKVRGASVVLAKEFPFASGGAVDALVEELRALDPEAAASLSKVAELFEESQGGLLSGSEVLGFQEMPEYAAFQKMDADAQNAVFAGLLAGFAQATSKAEMQQLFGYCVCLEELLALEETDIAAYMEKNKQTLGLTGSACYSSIYTGEYFGTAANRMAVAEWFAGRTWTQEEKKKENFADVFDEGVFLTVLVNLQTNGDLKNLVEAVPEWLKDNGADVDVYFELEKKSEVNQEIGGKYGSLDAFVEAFNKACEDASEGGGTSGGSTGSGSKGSGTSGGRIQTVISPTEQYQPEEVPLLTEAYSDIDSVEWAKEGIAYLTEKEILQGREAGKFYPNDTMKREEFTKVLTLAFDLSGEGEAPVFTDVPEDAWFHPFVARAAASGVVTGYGDSFGAGQPITRQDAAVMIYRAAQKDGKTFETDGSAAGFADEASIADYAKEAVEVLSRSGVINGVSESEFAPERYITRAEAAKLIYLLVK